MARIFRASHRLLTAGFLLALLAHASVAAVVYVRATTPGSVHDGLSWATAYQELQPALNAAQNGDEIWVASGFYIGPFNVQKALGVYGGFAGVETDRNSRSARDNATVLDGVHATDSVVNLGDGCTIDGFTIQNGGVQPFNGTGGGVRCVSGIGTVSNNVIRSCRSQDGGGVYCGESTSTYIVGNVFEGNIAAYGAAIEVRSKAIIARNSIHDNSGGAAITISAGPATVSMNSIIGNGGDGVYTANGGRNLVENNVIALNLSGVYCASGGHAPDNALITGNTIVRNAYGITYFGHWAAFTNNIIAFNPVAGIYSTGTDGPLTVRYNCVYGNGTDYAAEAYLMPLPDQTGINGNIKADPMFVRLLGATDSDYHIATGSPCIDTGEDAVIEAGNRDADGRLRIIGAHVDIGAYEWGVTDTYTLSDAVSALAAMGGLSAIAPSGFAHLNVDRGGTSANVVEMYDAVWIVRRAMGLDPA